VTTRPWGDDRLVAARSLAGAALAEMLHERLVAAGAEPLIFKGPVTEAWLFGAGEARLFGDIDVLVAPGAYRTAESVLEGAGFVSRWDGPSPAWAPEHAESWASRDWPLPVDLHRRIWGFGAAPEVVWAALWAEREPYATTSGRAAGQGPAFMVPRPAARALLVALHAAHHPGSSQPEDDLRRALAALPAETWDAAARLARSLDAEAALVAGLVRLPEGARVRNALGLGAVLPHMPRTESALWDAPPGSEGFVQLGATRGLASKVRLLRRELVPTAEFMRQRSRFVPLARRGNRGLAAAYVLRWLMLARNAPRSARAAAQERRRARSQEGVHHHRHVD
jgi:hypothetical protein